MKEQYTYAVARIRARKLSLLSEQDVGRLMACESYEECVNMLRDKGWGDETLDAKGPDCDYQLMLKAEERKLWQLVSELVADRAPFRVILLPVDYHNLKAAIKGYITESLSEDLFMPGGTVDVSRLTKCVEEGDFANLPQRMAGPAREAFEKLLHTGDGQLCDDIIDKALLNAIKTEGDGSKVGLIKAYAEFFVASADIKIVLRGQAMHKGREFLTSALVECDSLDVKKLAEAAMMGQADLLEYLEVTPYADVVPFVAKSLQKFDIWRDNRIIELIGAEKYDCFSIGPIIAYILAHQNEIKVARIILSGKRNRAEIGLIKERVRMMYA